MGVRPLPQASVIVEAAGSSWVCLRWWQPAAFYAPRSHYRVGRAWPRVTTIAQLANTASVRASPASPVPPERLNHHRPACRTMEHRSSRWQHRRRRRRAAGYSRERGARCGGSRHVVEQPTRAAERRRPTYRISNRVRACSSCSTDQPSVLALVRPTSSVHRRPLRIAPAAVPVQRSVRPLRARHTAGREPSNRRSAVHLQ